MKYKKSRSKSQVVKSILELVFKKFCDDEEVALLIQEYYKAEKKLTERRKKKQENKASTSSKKLTYKISQEVRDWLEPMVDAEYYKDLNYKPNLDCYLIYEAMQQLNTRVHRELTAKLLKDMHD